MKIYEILSESIYGYANTEHDRFFNPELVHFNDIQKERYAALERESNGDTPIITRIPKDRGVENYSNKPQTGAMESPGYRGLQKVKKRAGLPHDKFKDGVPAYRRGDEPFGPPTIFNS